MDNRKSRRLKAKTRQEKLMEGSDIEPITRMEQFLSRQAKKDRDYGFYITYKSFDISIFSCWEIVIRSKEMTKDEMQNFVGKNKYLIPYYYTSNGRWRKMFGWDKIQNNTNIGDSMIIKKADFAYNERNNTYRLKKVVRIADLFNHYAFYEGRLASPGIMDSSVNNKGFSVDNDGLGGTFIKGGSSWRWEPNTQRSVKVIDSSMTLPRSRAFSIYVDNRHAFTLDNVVCRKLIESTDFRYLSPLFYTYKKTRGSYNKMTLRFKVATMPDHHLNPEGYYYKNYKRVYWNFKMTDFIKNEVAFKKHLPLIEKSSGTVTRKVYLLYGYVREK